MTWLEKTPQGLVSAHLVMMTRLQADESIESATVFAVGGGSAKREARRAQMARWRRDSAGSVKPLAATPAALKGSGIGFRRVQK